MKKRTALYAALICTIMTGCSLKSPVSETVTEPESTAETESAERAGRHDTNEHDGCRDAQRQGGEVQPSAKAGLAYAECVHGNNLTLDRFQRGFGLTVT